jgi:hypothetical protein
MNTKQDFETYSTIWTFIKMKYLKLQKAVNIHEYVANEGELISKVDSPPSKVFT